MNTTPDDWTLTAAEPVISIDRGRLTVEIPYAPRGRALDDLLDAEEIMLRYPSRDEGDE